MRLARTIAVVAALAAGLLGSSWASAPTVEQFYSGRTITLFVGVAAGGLNDVAARLAARHMGRFIPGEPKFVVENLPGGGSIVLANRLAKTIERNGATLGMVDRGVVQLAVQGDPQA